MVAPGEVCKQHCLVSSCSGQASSGKLSWSTTGGVTDAEACWLFPRSKQPSRGSCRQAQDGGWVLKLSVKEGGVGGVYRSETKIYGGVRVCRGLIYMGVTIQGGNEE